MTAHGPILLRKAQPCPTCHGKGSVRRMNCPSCLGTGSAVLQNAIARKPAPTLTVARV